MCICVYKGIPSSSQAPTLKSRNPSQAVNVEVREVRGRCGAFEWPDLESMFTERLVAEDFADATVLDLGTGEGRLALLLAPRAKVVVGIDTDEDALAVAREGARAMGLANVTFVPADADTANYRLLVRSPIDFVVASHFMSESAIRETARALRGGAKFLFVAHHPDQWRETGQPSRFSFSERTMEDLLVASGFVVEFLGVDRTIVAYDNLAQFAEAHPTLRRRWKERGRWDPFAASVGNRRFELTWAGLVGVARRT